MSDEPECTETGCICAWVRSLDDERLIVAVQCAQREAFKRAGIDIKAVAEQQSSSMDPDQNALNAKIIKRFAKTNG